MSKPTHTKGDWTRGTNTASKNWMRVYCNGRLIAEAKTLSPNGQRKETDFKEEEANAILIAHAPKLLRMVRDLKDCIKRLTEDNLSQFDRDREAEWIGDAHELLQSVNPNYYDNANSQQP